MAQVRDWLQEGLVFVGVTLLVVVCLPLVALLALALRPLLMVVGVAMVLGGIVLYVLSPAFREWFEVVGEEQIRYKGLCLPTDIAVHPSHSWARIARQEVVVGADDLVQTTLGPVEAVELPAVGRRVEQGDRLFSLRRGSRIVEVRAPVSGTVLNRNETLLRRPWLVNVEPFAEGWAVRLRADKVRTDRQRLLRGKHARGWFRREIDRLIGTVISEGVVLPVLTDGGALVADLYRQIDDSAWKRLNQTFLGADTPKVMLRPSSTTT